MLLLFLLFLVSEGLLFVSFFWTSFHSLCSPTLGICFGEGFYLPDPCELTFANTLLLTNAAISLGNAFISLEINNDGNFLWLWTLRHREEIMNEKEIKKRKNYFLITWWFHRLRTFVRFLQLNLSANRISLHIQSLPFRNRILNPNLLQSILGVIPKSFSILEQFLVVHGLFLLLCGLPLMKILAFLEFSFISN